MSTLTLASSDLPIMRGVGGDFKADSSLGHKIKLSDFKGNIVLLTFGFTNCPDICPITLGYLNYLYNKLTVQQQKKVKVLFITVDPEGDTVEHLRKYVEKFNTDFIGVHMEKSELDMTTKKFGVSYAEVDVKLPTNYNRPLLKLDKDNTSKMFNHSISIFLLDKQSLVRGVYYSGSDSDSISSEIGKLLLEDDPNQQQNNITTTDFWIRLLPETSRVTAMYGKIKNNTNKTIQLTNIVCEDLANKSELHMTKITNSQAQMLHQPEIAIKPNATLVMKPMSYHVMLMGLKHKLVENKKINCTIEFNNGATKPIQVSIKKAGAMLHH